MDILFFSIVKGIHVWQINTAIMHGKITTIIITIK